MKALQMGCTTFPETDHPDPRSDCHAWSASPLYEMLATVCGIEPASPGFKSVRIEPHLGSLRFVQGKMPHPLGVIRIDLEREGEKGLKGRVVLPAQLYGSFHWKNHHLILKEGINIIDLN
ncbi:MAG: hypothetical protein Kow0042_14820 [Calditrichia bacterium]